MTFFTANTYINRRQQLKKTMGSGRILLLGNNESSINFKDNWYPFRQDSTFLYYFGISQPGLVGIIDVDEDEDIIFGEESSIDDVIWTGPLPSLASMAEKVGVTKVLPRVKLIKYINHGIHYLPPYRPEHSIRMSKLMHRKIPKVNKKYSRDLIRAIIDQRSIKSALEIGEIEKAITISDEMHLEVMRSAKPGMKEYELVAIAAKVAYDHNVHFSFPPILTKNGQTLHQHAHGNTINKGDMILFDGGCESPSFYAGDITRTFPVDKQFTSRQKDIYQIVHRAYSDAVKLLKPGIRFLDVHLCACRSVILGLKELGLVRGDVEEAITEGVHTLFFPHGLGHMMGLDVHDMENLGEESVGYSERLTKSKKFGLKSLRLGRELQEGFVLTIEPGIYMIPELFELRQSQGKYVDFVDYDLLETYKDFGGIRLEDNYVITSSGSHLLGIEMPRTADEIEKERK